ncbi:hypothetical protein ACFOWA_11740 [Pedobacter lithocola]|uniref:Lipoprotein n=1 Tax=Pedobacter lithocola TaxID=1908239 RepID=A0ABV8P984_9SPHI
MRRISFIAMIMLSVLACKNRENKTVEEPNDSIETQILDNAKDTSNTQLVNNYIEVNTWVDDLKNFRQALYTKDIAKLKTYFIFPYDGDKSSIWSQMSFNDVEIAARKSKYVKPELFYAEDFNKYFDIIFNADFVKTIMKIKTSQLYSKHHSETPQFIADEQTYEMIADYNKEQNVLQLNMSYDNNSLDENGEKVSEGEHNVIYIFDVIDGKNIIFKKLELAG